MNTITAITASVAAANEDREEVGHGNHGGRSKWRRLERTYSGGIELVKGKNYLFFGILAQINENLPNFTDIFQKTP